MLIVRHGEAVTAYDAGGSVVPLPAVPFAQTLAASVISQQEPCLIREFGDSLGSLTLYPFEQNRTSILAAPMSFGSCAQAVLELFDTPADRKTIAAFAAVGTELLKQSFQDRQTQRLLFDAVEAALKAGENVTASFRSGEVMDRLRIGLTSGGQTPGEADAGLKLVEAVRALTAKYGQPAIDHGLRMVESTRQLLEETQG
jgi:hypothetical protein